MVRGVKELMTSHSLKSSAYFLIRSQSRSIVALVDP